MAGMVLLKYDLVEGFIVDVQWRWLTSLEPKVLSRVLSLD